MRFVSCDGHHVEATTDSTLTQLKLKPFVTRRV